MEFLDIEFVTAVASTPNWMHISFVVLLAHMAVISKLCMYLLTCVSHIIVVTTIKLSMTEGKTCVINSSTRE